MNGGGWSEDKKGVHIDERVPRTCPEAMCCVGVV